MKAQVLGGGIYLHPDTASDRRVVDDLFVAFGVAGEVVGSSSRDCVDGVVGRSIYTIEIQLTPAVPASRKGD